MPTASSLQRAGTRPDQCGQQRPPPDSALLTQRRRLALQSPRPVGPGRPASPSRPNRRLLPAPKAPPRLPYFPALLARGGGFSLKYGRRCEGGRGGCGEGGRARGDPNPRVGRGAWGVSPEQPGRPAVCHTASGAAGGARARSRCWPRGPPHRGSADGLVKPRAEPSGRHVGGAGSRDSGPSWRSKPSTGATPKELRCRAGLGRSRRGRTAARQAVKRLPGALGARPPAQSRPVVPSPLRPRPQRRLTTSQVSAEGGDR